MTEGCDITRTDILHIVQSIAQSIRGDSAQQIGKAAFFPNISYTAELTRAQNVKLALLAVNFLDIACETDKAQRLYDTLPTLPDLHAWADHLFAAWGKNSLCFNSSGSTGEPQRHRYSLPILSDELKSSAPAFAGCKRIVSVMPVHHIFGMMYGPLLAKYLSVQIVYAPPLPLASFFHLLLPEDLIVAFPFFWQALLNMILRTQKSSGLCFPPNVAGLTATSPCPPEVIQGLLHLSASGKSPSLTAMTEIYGATETNGLGMRLNGADWYELFSVWETSRLEDGSRGLRRRLPGGGMGPSQPMPDHITWHDERRFKPERRTDNAVQVGGINVYPERVAEIIRGHPLVLDCAVRLMRPDEGLRLKTFIVPNLPLEESRQAFGKPFKDWMASQLETAWRPKRITLGEYLPVNAMGKLRDWE